MLAGCSHESQPKAKPLKPMEFAPPAPVIAQREQQLKAEQPENRHPAKEGRPPLVYMLESPAQVQVVDSYDGAVLASATLTARSIISVDSAAGIRASGQQLSPGPIAGQHVYQIFVITGTENEYRTGLIRPAPQQDKER
jgi:hypothetical protein